MVTRNIRKPGFVGKFNFCTFTQTRNGLISWSFEIPASTYCQTLYASVEKRLNTLKRYREIKKRINWIGAPLIGQCSLKGIYFVFSPPHKV